MPRKKPEGLVMPGIKHELDCHGRPIEVLALADLHIGDPHSDKRLINELISSVKDDDNRYCVLAGDLMNTAITGSKSDSYAETLRPSEQLEQCYELFAPIRDKIIAIVPGNHEERITRTAGTDMTRMLARELGLQDVYRDNSALVILRFGHSYLHSTPLTYSLYVNHGHGGGGRRAGSKLNSLQDFASIIDADCFIVGHTHLPASFKQSQYRISPQRGVAVLHEQLFVNTASALTYGGYGNRGGYQPPSNSYPVITLDNRNHHMSVTL